MMLGKEMAKLLLVLGLVSFHDVKCPHAVTLLTVTCLQSLVGTVSVA